MLIYIKMHKMLNCLSNWMVNVFLPYVSECVRFEGIKFEDWRDYITEPLGQVFEDFTSVSN